MNTNRIELSLDELEAVNGGWDWLSAAMGGLIGGTGGAGIGLMATAAAASGPVGWVILAGGAAGALAVGAITGNFD